MAVLNLVLKATDGGAAGALSGLDGQVTKLDQTFSQKLGSIGGSMQKLGAGLTLGVTTPIVAGFMAITDGAGDLAETVSKTEALFGDNSAAILAWSDTTAKSLGISKVAALDAASTFQMFGKSMGLTGQEQVAFSEDFTQLAADLASFNNTSVDQAIGALGAAFRGESEPIRAFNVMLDESTLKAKAMELGIYSGTGALSQQQKMLATQASILEQTTVQQGDFGRTSGGAAGQQKILEASLKNTADTLGKQLLPLQIKLLENLNGLVDWFGNLSEGTQGWIVKLGLAAAAAGPVITVVGTLAKGFSLVSGLLTGVGALGGIGGGLTAAFGALGPVIAALTGPIGIVVGAVGLLATAWFKDWGGIRTKTKEFVGDIWEGMKAFGSKVGDWGGKLWAWLRDTDYKQMSEDILDGMLLVFVKAPAALFEAFRKMFSGAFDMLKDWLGIASPSKKAAREIGLPIAQGVGAGMAAGMPSAMRQVTNHTQQYFNVYLSGTGNAGQDVTNSVQMLATLYG